MTSIYSLSSILAASFSFLIALFVVWRGRSRQNLCFSLLAFVIAIWTCFPWATQTVDPSYRDEIARIVYIPACFVPTLFLAFVLAVTNKPTWGWGLKSSLLTSLFFWLNIGNPYFIRGVKVQNGASAPIPGGLYAVFVLFFLIICGYAFYLVTESYRISSLIQKNRLKFVFIAFSFAYIAGSLHFLSAYTGWEPLPHDILIVFFVSFLAYAIVKHRLMDINVIIRKTVTYSIVTGTLTGGYLLIITLFTRMFQGLTGYQTVFSAAVAAGLITVFFQPLRKRVQDWTDQKFFRRYVDRDEKLYELSRDVVTHATAEEMANAITRVLQETLHPKVAALYLKAREGTGYSQFSTVPETELPLVMPDDNALGLYFIDHPQPFVLQSGDEDGKPHNTRTS